MPTDTTGSIPTSQRRPGGVTRGRENRSQTPLRGPHTPESWSVEDAGPRADPVLVRKRRRVVANHPHCHPSTSNNPSHAHPKPNTRPQRDSTASTETDHSRKSKPKHKPTSDEVEMFVIQDTQTRTNGKAKRADRSRSRDTSNRASAKGLSAPGSDEDVQEGKVYTGPLAIADHTRLKSELDSWKKKAHSNEKKLNKRNEEIEKLRKELATLQQSDAERSSQLDKLKKQSKKSSDIISSIETNMACNICMDIMLKPFGLSPCGHVLCQTCLQEWFRTAPSNDEEVFDDDTPEALLYRKKTCPMCRAIIRTRPIPLFLVKSIATALQQFKSDTAKRDSPPPSPEASDPWAGIFLDPAEEDESHSEEDDSDEDDYDDYDDQWSSEYGSGSESDHQESSYTFPSWAPPTVHVSAFDFPYMDAISSEDLSMLRRGCTLAMIELFDMHYDHATGLTAVVDGNTICLGWNIRLLPNDETGEEFIDWLLRDMHEHPERWETEEQEDDVHWYANRLIPVHEHREYDTDDEDSDIWAVGLVEEDSMNEF